ncbi:MAG: iron ABC transporter permease [Propionibacteriaceae bacterium]|nr:iron ABC transporter permease [Propionibacteriaceae bacterium]
MSTAAVSAHRRGMTKPDVWTGASTLLTLVYLVVVVWPMVMVLRQSVWSDGAFAWDSFTTFFTTKLYTTALGHSLLIGFGVTILSLIVAYILAYLMTMFKVRGRGAIQVLILASMMSPPFIGAYSWILLLGNNGVITQTLRNFLHIQAPSIYGLPGILIVLTLQLVPLIFTYLMGAWRTVDVSVLEAAESMGCTGAKRAFRVVLPLLVPTVLAGSLLVFVRAFADFGTPMLIGRGYQTMPYQIYGAATGEVSTNMSFAAALSVIVIVLTLVIFFVQRFVAGRRSFAMNALRPIQAKQLPGGRSALVHVIIYGYLVISLLPLLVVIISSFRLTRMGQFIPGLHFTLNNYINASSDITRAIKNTFVLGLTALVVLVVVAIVVSYITVRRPNPINRVLDALTMVPYVVPGLVIGIAFMLTFSGAPLPLTGTAVIMVIALAIRRMSYTIRSTTALLGQVSPSIEEAAQSLGASKVKTLVRVIVPVLAPGIFAGAVLSWVTIITELSTTLFLYTNATQTLSLLIYATVVRAQLGTAGAEATILLVITILSLFLLTKLPGGNDNLKV